MDSNYSALPRDSYVELQSSYGKSSTDTIDIPEISLKPFNETENFEEDLNSNEDGNTPLFLDLKSTGSGVSGAVFNLSTTIIGAGIMALPAAMKVLGLFLGVSLIILIGIISELSVELIVRFSTLRKALSYGDLVQSALGRHAKVLSEICIIVNNGGVLVVYLIIMGDVISGSSHHMGVLDQWLGNGFWDHRRVLILLVVVFFLAPLCALEKIDSLSLTSAASVALAVVFVFASCSIAFVKLMSGTIEHPRLGPDFGSKKAILDLLVVIPIMVNAYVCHFNVQPIYNELDARSPQKMKQVGRLTTVLCVTVYALTAISCYLLFGDATESDVLINFDKDLGVRFSTALNYVIRIGYILHLVLVFPVVHFSLRQTVDELVFSKCVPLGDSRKRLLLSTAVLLLLIYVASTMIPNIWVAFKFTGATTAVSLGFIFPSLVALKLGKKGNSLALGLKILSWIMLLLAILVGIIGIVGNIYSINSRTQ